MVAMNGRGVDGGARRIGGGVAPRVGIIGIRRVKGVRATAIPEIPLRPFGLLHLPSTHEATCTGGAPRCESVVTSSDMLDQSIWLFALVASAAAFDVRFDASAAASDGRIDAFFAPYDASTRLSGHNVSALQTDLELIEIVTQAKQEFDRHAGD